MDAAIVVQGLHYMTFPDGRKREVHNAVAMIKYDPNTDRFHFISQLATGRSGNYWGMVTDAGKFQWTIPETPIGKMTYTISVSNGTYHETGELTLKSGKQKKFFEMTLSKSVQ